MREINIDGVPRKHTRYLNTVCDHDPQWRTQGGGGQSGRCPGTSGADSIGHGARAFPPPHFYEWPGTGGAPWVEEQQTRNWPNCTDHESESAHQND